MDMRQVEVHWTGAGLRPAVTVHNFNTSGSIEDQRDALAAWCTALKTDLHQATTWEVSASGSILNDADGSLRGAWADSRPLSGTGNPAGSVPMANQTAILARWHTGVVYLGRFVQGRTFIPGITAAAGTLGEVSSAAQGRVTSAGNALISSGAGLLVWSRPRRNQDGLLVREGRAFGATVPGVWSEFAVQRGRRG